MMSETANNMKEVFAGESQAYQRYLAFAQQAADEYMEGVYKLFQAVAASEKIHACEHVAAGEPPERCPIRGAVKRSFQKVEP
jgi:rubrerythrin